MSSTSATISRLDTIYRSVLLSKFFVKGWGDPENMKKIFKFRKIISNRATCQYLVDKKHPIYIDRVVEENESYKLYEGHFFSPLVNYLYDLVPPESHIARFQMMLPTKWSFDYQLKPLCLHLAGTGDHNFWRRRNFMAKPLLRDYGIGSIILENPFYGVRKPINQNRSNLNNVSDIFIMGGCLILESIALFHWVERMGFGPLCVTGISMGGHNASLAATSWYKPIGVVPCLSWTTASCVFTQGVMSGSVPWQILESQYLSYGQECKEEFDRLINSPEKITFDKELVDAGKTFAKSFINFNNFLSDLNMSLSSYLEKLFSSTSFTSTSNSLRKTKLINETMLLKRNTFNFMRGIMDECTHLANFSPLVDPELAIIINARHDGYVPSHGVMPLTNIWPGSTVRYLNRGHVSAILLDNDVFRQAIADSLNLTASKYYGGSLFNGELNKTKKRA
ncbi:hypothetical protein RDWZM_005959 [Blomia tropicalis]|uniref:Protein ABHD18 n=1 Tax=Blomia tropicalis TaxID=40697 RepID=A0A9Q0M6Z6_BLOTA|nr:hypothetical protein BLOT_006699 [Blomia tropicalis]KAJ6220147.1 hypothetical protein RDWZM_005959 [Blomia tropicalis]